MKKYNIIAFLLVVAAFFAICGVMLFGEFELAKAEIVADESKSFNIKYVEEIFGEMKIRSIETLYNLDDSPDFIYVEFEEDGYAIFFAQTGEMLQYSLVDDSIPYPKTIEKKYYAGPENYFIKTDSGFENIQTGFTTAQNEDEKKKNSQALRNLFLLKENQKENNKKNGFCSFNDEKSRMNRNVPQYTSPIPASPPGAVGTTYISNAEYFLNDPMHGKNQSGTCSAIAAQLLLSYNNYYSDRRIIKEEFLNGYWDTVGNCLTSTFYPEQSPNYCTNLRNVTSEILGSNGYNEADNNTFFKHIINYIPASSTAYYIKQGLRNYINARNNQIAGSIQCEFYWDQVYSNPIGSVYIVNEINADRPTIVTMTSNFGGNNHSVLAYGYQNYTYPVGDPHSGETYFGYIVHFGWSSASINSWINSAWCDGYVRMIVNHTHSYTPIMTNIMDNAYVEFRCTTCGCRVADPLYEVENGIITKARYDRTGTVIIPASIDGITITGIGDHAFMGKQLGSISIPSNVTGIGILAFANCTALQSITYNTLAGSQLHTIGDGAFSGCTSLKSVTIPRRVTTIGDMAFFGCTGSSFSVTFNVPLFHQLTAIGNEAFSGCTHLSAIELPPLVTKIGFCAFDSTVQLTSFSGTPANIDLPVLSGTKSTYESNGWTGFNFVEVTGSGAFKVTSGQLRGEVTIPAYLNGRAITKLDKDAFKNQTSITRIEFGSVTEIGENAFSGCSNLETVFFLSMEEDPQVADQTVSYTNGYCCDERYLNTELIAGVTYTFSFYHSYLQTSDQYDIYTCLGVGETAFTYEIARHSCSSNGTETIVFTPTEAQLAVSNKLWCRFISTETIQTLSTNISNVWLYRGVMNVDVTAFTGCPKLETPGLAYQLQDNSYKVTGFQGLESLYYIFCRALFIPSSHNGLPVSGIVADAFAQDELMRWLFIQTDVSVIGERGFQNCSNLEVADLSGSSVTQISAYAFDHCNLSQFAFSPNLVSIGAYAFYGANLSTVDTIPATVTILGNNAFENVSFATSFALPASSALTSIGAYAFKNCNLKRLVIPSTVTTIGNYAFIGNSNSTIFVEPASKPNGWSSNWNYNGNYVVWGCTLSANKTQVKSITKNATNVVNYGAMNDILNPTCQGYNFSGWYENSNLTGTKYSDISSIPNNTTVYAKWGSQCVAERTLVTLADGTQVAVEDLTGNEELLVWNLETGEFDSAPILFIDSDPSATYEITHLYFSDGTEVKIIDEHAFWDVNLNEYVFLRNDAARYIGHYFSKQAEDNSGNMIRTTVQLVDVDVYYEQTTAWSPVTYGHLCLYVNGMLSMPGATEGLVNIFDVDALTMAYDPVAFAADISLYGLYTYEEFSALVPIPETIFDAFNGQYLKVSIGKGLITLADIGALAERYASFF